MTQRELLRLASELAQRGEPFAIATVVQRRAPTSSSAGDMGLVRSDGEFHGFVGGSCTRPTVVEQALAALSDGRPRLIALSPDPAGASPGATLFPMTCHSGGSVEIHIQPVLPAPLLLVYGLTPTARALVRLGAAMGYRVWAIEPAAEKATLPGGGGRLRRSRRRDPASPRRGTSSRSSPRRANGTRRRPWPRSRRLRATWES